MWFFYELLYVIGLLLYLPLAVWRRRLPHRGWGMRLGRYPRHVVEPLRDRQSLWLHAVSVGEVLAAQPLLRALTEAYPQHMPVVSTITPGGFEVASKQLGERGVTAYFPLDLRGCVTRALEALHPRILLLMESELWPMVVQLAKARGVPIAVINGRISPRAFRRYEWIRPWLAGVLDGIDLFLMQSQTDADRLVQLGAPLKKVRVVGSLKWDASLNSRPSPQAIQEAAARIGVGPDDLVLVAGSTHRGEEAAVLAAFQRIRALYPGARLLVAPRHLERVAEIEGLIRQAHLTSVRLSHDPLMPGWDIGIVDSFGQLPFYYGMATLVFIGGSLIPHGGQNPLEAASLCKPIIFGPSMHNFADISHQLLAHHAARRIERAEELASLFQELLEEPVQTQKMGQRAQELTEGLQGTTQRTLEALKPHLS